LLQAHAENLTHFTKIIALAANQIRRKTQSSELGERRNFLSAAVEQ